MLSNYVPCFIARRAQMILIGTKVTYELFNAGIRERDVQDWLNGGLATREDNVEDGKDPRACM